MSLVGFGQPDDGIIQMCYLVPDIRAAMKLWIDKLKVGPWFLLDHFGGTNPKYRGRDSKADVSLVMSFAGHRLGRSRSGAFIHLTFTAARGSAGSETPSVAPSRAKKSPARCRRAHRPP